MDKISTLAGGSPLDSSQHNAALDKAKSIQSRALKSDEEVEKAASGFEALLLHQMLKSMWETVETTGMFGEDSNQSKIYQDMLNQAVADSVSEGRGIGVKEFVKKELLKQSDDAS